MENDGLVKFRAWDKDRKMMLTDFDQDSARAWGLKPGESIHNAVWTLGLLYGTLRQFIGRTDKHGIEIWEGTILQIDATDDNSKCLVVRDGPAFKRSYLPFLSEEKRNDPDFFEKDYIHHFDRIDFEMWVVIGDVDRNPELLISQS